MSLNGLYSPAFINVYYTVYLLKSWQFFLAAAPCSLLYYFSTLQKKISSLGELLGKVKSTPTLRKETNGIMGGWLGGDKTAT